MEFHKTLWNGKIGGDISSNVGQYGTEILEKSKLTKKVCQHIAELIK